MSQYQAIKAFVRGYLHEDAVAEYGSAQGAAEQFRKDADEEQLHRLGSEWESFQASHNHLDDINEALHRLGCAWQFHSTDEFRRMIAAFKASQ